MTCIGPMGQGIRIMDNCNTSRNNIAKLCQWFELPEGIQSFSNEAESYLAGSNSFKVLEIEVYKLE